MIAKLYKVITSKWFRKAKGNDSIKVILFFLVANICALLPLLWTVVGWMPEQVMVHMRGNEGLSILYRGTITKGEDYGRWKEGRVWRFYLQEGMKLDNLTFLLSPGTNPTDVERVEFQKWKLVRLVKRGTGLEGVRDVPNGWRFEESRFDSIGGVSGKVLMGVALAELLLLALSRVFAAQFRAKREKQCWKAVVLVALVLAVLTQGILPVQSYWANQSAYPFSSGALIGSIFMRFIGFFVLAGIAVGLLTYCFGPWVLGMVLAFTVCIYLESGVLSAGLPDLNGDWYFCQNRTRALWDTVAWIGIFVLFGTLHAILKKHYGLTALCLLALGMASLFDVQHERKANTSDLIVNDFCPVETAICSTVFSSNRNVLVFVLDSLEREQAHDIMQDPEAGPELREKYRGFTEYVDNVGAWSTSLPAVANMFTGLNSTKAFGVADYFAAPYASASVLNDYLEAGYAVFIDTEPLGYGYTNQRTGAFLKREKAKPFFCRLPGELGWTLQEVVRFRTWPFAAKKAVASLTTLGIPPRVDWGEERIVFPVLAERPVTGMEGSFLFCHTRGVHWPVVIDRNGDRLPRPDNTVKGCREAGIWVLGQLGLVFDALRTKGVYDNSLILVLADHGNHDWSGRALPENLPGNGRPFLWVKAPHCTHDFLSDNTPTYHGRIFTLLKKSCKEELSEDEIMGILSSERREYHLVSGFDGDVTVWNVDLNGVCSLRTETVEGKELMPLENGRVYRFDHNHIAEDGAGVEFVHCGFGKSPVWEAPNPVEIRFRTAQAAGRYRVRITLQMTKGRNQATDSGEGYLFMGQKESGEGVEVAPMYRTNVVLHGLCPDPLGDVVLVGERMNGLNANVSVMDMVLEEE